MPIQAILGTAAMDVSGLTTALTLSAFQGVIEALLPIVAVAVLVGFLFFFSFFSQLCRTLGNRSIPWYLTYGV